MLALLFLSFILSACIAPQPPAEEPGLALGVVSVEDSAVLVRTATPPVFEYETRAEHWSVALAQIGGGLRLEARLPCETTEPLPVWCTGRGSVTITGEGDLYVLHAQGAKAIIKDVELIHEDASMLRLFTWQGSVISSGGAGVAHGEMDIESRHAYQETRMAFSGGHRDVRIGSCHAGPDDRTLTAYGAASRIEGTMAYAGAWAFLGVVVDVPLEIEGEGCL